MPNEKINVAIIGVGNCAASLTEGLSYYRQYPDVTAGLLFPLIGKYSVSDIDIKVAFDISKSKVGLPLKEAIYQKPNNFIRKHDSLVDCIAPVLRGPTLDGNPDHLAKFVEESPIDPVDVAKALKDYKIDVLVNLIPTGSHQASEFYMRAALEAGCSFVNCIPTIIAQRPEVQSLFINAGLPIFGDDIKSQLGTTILHRTLLKMLELRGATLRKSSQINIGGNTDFANFVYRAESKLVSKRKSLENYLQNSDSHVGHHYDFTKGPLKKAIIELEADVFGLSPVKITLNLESDDKPNSAGSVVDLIRLAKTALDRKVGGVIPEVCALYFKSPPVEIEETQALELIKKDWAMSS